MVSILGAECRDPGVWHPGDELAARECQNRVSCVHRKAASDLVPATRSHRARTDTVSPPVPLRPLAGLSQHPPEQLLHLSPAEHLSERRLQRHPDALTRSSPSLGLRIDQQASSSRLPAPRFCVNSGHASLSIQRVDCTAMDRTPADDVSGKWGLGLIEL